jgi:hypothetical protein
VVSNTYAYGLRNPYRISIDRLTGDMYIGEVGNAAGGAVFFNANGHAGTNFGYTTNGGHEIAGGVSGFDGSSKAIIGGIVYRGSKIPELCGRYIYGTWDAGTIKSLVIQNGQRVGAVTPLSGLSVPSLTSFGEDNQGEIIMSSQQGQLYRLEK